jgi:very-short-patch-repair endonuclease
MRWVPIWLRGRLSMPTSLRVTLRKAKRQVKRSPSRMVGRVHNRKDMLATRRKLRRDTTNTEAALWALLKGRALGGRKFRRQHSVGPYVLDFYCPEERLAVELDGPLHDGGQRREHDAERTWNLESMRIRVMRFRNPDVVTRPDFVTATIASCFGSRNSEHARRPPRSPTVCSHDASSDPRSSSADRDPGESAG